MTRGMASWLAALSTLALAACGGSGSGTGTLSGASFKVAGVISGDVSGPSKGSVLQIALSSDAQACDSYAQGPTQAQELLLSLYTVDAQKVLHAASAPGTFTTDLGSAGPYADAELGIDGTCSGTTDHDFVQSGKVVVTELDGNAAKGTFDLTMEDGAHLTGSFDSAGCEGMQAAALREPVVCP